MRQYLAFGAGLALAVFGAASHALAAGATILGPSVSDASCNSNNPSNTVTDASICKLQGAQVQISQTPFVGLEATVNDPAGIATQDAFADLSYQFAVVGGLDGQVVQVNIFTNLIAEADPFTNAFANMSYGAGQTVSVCQGGDGCTASGFHDFVSYLVTVGVAQDIAFHIGAENTFLLGGRAFASADPLITIAAADNPDGSLHVILSDGVGNGLPPTGVPEPAAWALMLAGFGLSGAALRRRRGASVTGRRSPA
ncbi:MAG: PEPxxWA-CTERM sorting domain-containing protein [Phenylobacterium sp.]